jgi:hypothetical protein
MQLLCLRTVARSRWLDNATRKPRLSGNGRVCTHGGRMKPSHIDSLQASLQLARERLQDCRNQRQLFEQQMDINSCEDHRVLQRLLGDEKKSERDVQVAEQQILDARQRGRFNLAETGIGKIWRWLPSVRRR